MVLSNFVFIHQEKKSYLSVWLVYYIFILAGICISFVVSFFQLYINPYYQLGTLIHIGESFSLFTL